MSAATSARNVGVAGEPVAGPDHIKLALCVANVTANVPDDVIGLPPTLNIPGTVIATLVTYANDGMSVDTSARKLGVAGEPEVGPAQTKFAV